MTCSFLLPMLSLIAATALSLSAFNRAICSWLLVEFSAIFCLKSASLSILYAATSRSASSLACFKRAALAAKKKGKTGNFRKSRSKLMKATKLIPNHSQAGYNSSAQYDQAVIYLKRLFLLVFTFSSLSYNCLSFLFSKKKLLDTILTSRYLHS